jgi:hypothetical protein
MPRTPVVNPQPPQAPRLKCSEIQRLRRQGRGKPGDTLHAGVGKLYTGAERRRNGAAKFRQTLS